MVYFQTNELMNYSLENECSFTSIDDISQPFHQRCSELATKGCSGILTELLLKTVMLKAVGHFLAAELERHPNLVYHVFCSLKIDHMQSLQLAFSKYFFIVAYHSMHMHFENQCPDNRQNSES